MTVEVVCPTLVARREELARLEAALDELSESGAVFGLVGEAGIGKSRLAAEVAAIAVGRGIPVLMGRAVDAGTPVPFRPLFEALSGYFRQAAPDAHADLASFRSTLSTIVPEWGAPGKPAAFRVSAMELGEALLRLLTGIAGGRGCVLVLEDLHWADPDTIAVLEYLGDNLASAGVLCVVTLRTDSNGDALRTVRALASRRSASVLELRRLRADELIDMTQRCLDVDAVPEDVYAVVQRFSDGLPFLVEELLASAIASGALVDGPDGWQVMAGARPAVP